MNVSNSGTSAASESALEKLAIACGATPLLAGTAIYLGWRVTRLDVFIGLGMINIAAGLLLFTIGVGCLLVQRHRDHHGTNGGGSSRRAWLIGGLLLVNFPAAAVYGVSAIDVMGRETVRIINDSGARIDNVVLLGPGVKNAVGPIPAGGRVRRYLRFAGDGTLEFSARQNEVAMQGELEDYVTGGWGGDVTLHLLPDGKFEVRDNGNTPYYARD